MDMRKEIRKLESENKELGQPPAGRENAGPAFQHRHAADTSTDTSIHANLRRNASAPTLERQYKENIIMTVRRYSIAPAMRTGSWNSERLLCGQENAAAAEERSSDRIRLTEESRVNTPALLDQSARGDSNIYPKEKITNRRSLQEYMHKNRAKVKTVTFLLPVEDIYTNRPFRANHRPDRNTYDLGVIVEKDS